MVMVHRQKEKKYGRSFVQDDDPHHESKVMINLRRLFFLLVVGFYTSVVLSFGMFIGSNAILDHTDDIHHQLATSGTSHKLRKAPLTSNNELAVNNDSHRLTKIIMTETTSRVWEICETTFKRDALSIDEQNLLVFTAPPKLDKGLPFPMKTWAEALRGYGQYVVFTNDAQTQEVCRQNSIPTICVEHSDEGLPRLDKMFERMHALGKGSVVAYVNSDIEVHNCNAMNSLLNSLQSKEKGLELMVTPSADLYQEYIPTGKHSKDWFIVVTRIDVLHNGTEEAHNKGGYDFWAWNTGPTPLLPFDIPPFRFPYAIYDNWLLDMVLQSGQRNVIDATAALKIYHKAHENRGGHNQTWTELFLTGASSGVYINRYLGYNEPGLTINAMMSGEDASLAKKAQELKGIRHYWQFGTPVECPYYVVKEGSAYKFERNRYWSPLPFAALQTTGCVGNKTCVEAENHLSRTAKEERNVAVLPFADTAALKSTPAIATAKYWRYTIDKQLEMHVNENGFVMMTAVNYAYREHLTNWICSLQRVGMKNYVIAALDLEIYKWGVLHGLPIYLSSSAMKNTIDQGNQTTGGKYNSQGFRKLTKLKSVSVLEVLRKHYSVIWSDVDITWFRHPFEALSGYLRSDGGIAIQSNAPFVANPNRTALPHPTVKEVKTDNPAGFRRLNSGLYVAPSHPMVISAFQDIINDAAQSSFSEQPSFDLILCDRAPSQRGYDTCLYRPEKKAADNFTNTSLSVHLLDRFQFPAGAVLVGDDNKNVYELGAEKFSALTGVKLSVAHNNWIVGETAKKERQISAGWWFIDERYTCTFLGESKKSLFARPNDS